MGNKRFIIYGAAFSFSTVFILSVEEDCIGLSLIKSWYVIKSQKSQNECW